ncbi:MAG TPA: FtsK/SpoIIIE domain-containing protein, partial [Chloroflexota bacterium]|nr:FtsK/SpoIIIE domain-containing protein [Chloroflexota bacterium]
MVVGQRRHLGRVEFNRPPRLREMPAKRQVKIPAPPAAVGRPGGSIMGSLIVPTVSTAAMGSVFLLAALLTQGVQPVVLAASSAALLLGAVLPAAWFFFEDRRRAERETQQQTADYRRRLHNVETELQQLRAQEQAIRLEHDPDAEALLRRARELHRQLWERRAGDDDFLVLRLGLGLARSYVEVVGHEPETAGLTSPEAQLAQEARSLAARFALVPDVPIVADLKAAVAVGLTGPAARTRALARSVLCQAATHHSPDELLLVGFFTGESLPEWAWLKWLPHVRPQRELDGGSTLLGWEAQGREQLARWLLNELTNRRRLVLEAGTSESAPVFPWILVFTDDFATVRAEAAIQLALAEGARLRVAVVGLAENLAALPRGCGGVSAFEPRQGGLLNYTNTGVHPEPIQGMADEVTPELAEEIARALAAVTVVQEQAAGDVPERVSLFDALGIAAIERAGVARRWAQLDLAGLLCTPLGAMAEGKLLSLDLKEQALGGQGPHGLVAGTTGAGKSELLLSIIAGLALRHPPHVLNFVLVDYKGGEAFRPVADLPHTVSLITDLDEHLAHRALAFLRSELKLRERRLGELKAAGT